MDSATYAWCAVAWLLWYVANLALALLAMTQHRRQMGRNHVVKMLLHAPIILPAALLSLAADGMLKLFRRDPAIEREDL